MKVLKWCELGAAEEQQEDRGGWSTLVEGQETRLGREGRAHAGHEKTWHFFYYGNSLNV